MKLKIIPTKPLTLSNVGKLSWSWILKTISKFRKRKKKFSSSLVYVFQKTWNEALSCRRRAVTKKRDARVELLFCILFAFLPSRFCRRRGCLKPRPNERNISLRASPGRSGGGRGKGKRACNYVSVFWISASKTSMRNADWRRWH